MLIIKKGIFPKDSKPDPESEHRGICDFCRAEFIFKAKEGTFYKSDSVGCLGVWCPTCEKAVYISI